MFTRAVYESSLLLTINFQTVNTAFDHLWFVHVNNFNQWELENKMRNKSDQSIGASKGRKEMFDLMMHYTF